MEHGVEINLQGVMGHWYMYVLVTFNITLNKHILKLNNNIRAESGNEQSQSTQYNFWNRSTLTQPNNDTCT